jgi:predicted branched-subunit amino acid permease
VNAPARRDITRRALAIGAATGIYGISFGVLSVAAGLSPAQTCAMSLLVFTGASQFSLVSVIGAGGSPASALAGAGLLAVRNGVYGLSLAPSLFDRDGPERSRHTLGRRLAAAQLVLDESTAMATAQQDRHHRRAAFWITGGCEVVMGTRILISGDGVLMVKQRGAGVGEPNGVIVGVLRESEVAVAIG